MNSPAIVGIGAVFIDDIVLPDGKTYMGRLGGGAVYAMTGVALWGERPGLIAVAGRDLPEAAAAYLDTYFDTRGVRRLPLPQMRAWELFEEDGTRTEIYRVSDTEPFIAGAQPEHFPDAYHGARYFYLHQDVESVRRWRERLDGFLLYEPLRRVMFDRDPADFRRLLRDGDINLVSPSYAEAQNIYGQLIPDDIVSALLDDGAQAVALRIGARGSILASRQTNERFHIGAAPVTKVVDQTGAGNTYCGGLLWGLARGKPLQEAGIAGAVSASFCLESAGVVDLAHVSIKKRDERYERLRHTCVKTSPL